MDENPLETQTTKAESSQERLQELAIIVSDNLKSLNRRWWYAVMIAFVLCFPLYFGLRAGFTSGFVASHKFPSYKQQDETKVSLEVSESKIFDLGSGNYSGYAKIKNSANLEWGAASQVYTASFLSNGSEVKKYSGTTFVLPASTKILYFPRFAASSRPDQLAVKLGNTSFIKPPSSASYPKFTIERNDMQVLNGQLIINASIRNDTPFTIARVDLPVLVYDASNNIVAVNYTNLNDLKYQETRSFQFSWPNTPAKATRDEILPEVNLFDPNIYQLPAGTSPFGNSAPQNP